MEITSNINNLIEAMSSKRQLKYNERYSVHYIPLTTEQNKTFEHLYHTYSKEDFTKLLDYDKNDILIFGNTDVDQNKYDKDPAYAESITTYLEQAIPSINDKIRHIKMYACFCTFRVTKGVEFFEPTLLSSWRCLTLALGNPDCILCVRVKNK